MSTRCRSSHDDLETLDPSDGAFPIAVVVSSPPVVAGPRVRLRYAMVLGAAAATSVAVAVAVAVAVSDEPAGHPRPAAIVRGLPPSAAPPSCSAAAVTARIASEPARQKAAATLLQSALDTLRDVEADTTHNDPVDASVAIGYLSSYVDGARESLSTCGSR